MALEAVGSNPITHPIDPKAKAFGSFLMHRKSRCFDPAVLLRFVTGVEQIGGRRGLSVPAFFALEIA